MSVKELKLNLKPLVGQLNLSSANDVTGALTGNYSTLQKGRGLEFGGYRPYTPQDDAKSIDWKASMKSQTILVRELIEEKNLNVFFLFDVSNSMQVSSVDKTKCEYGIEVISTMAFGIIRAGDSVGLSLFNDKIISTIQPNVGSGQYFRLLSELTRLENLGGNYDIENALKTLSTFLKKQKALIILVSDFIGIKGSKWEHHLKGITSKFDLIPIMIRDPIDLKMPKYTGELIIEDPFSNKQILINPSNIKDEYEAQARKLEKQVFATFKKYHVEVLKLRTDKPFIKDLITFLQKRNK